MSNATVLSFARTNLGSQVGAGECFDLADRALRSGGDKSAADFGSVTPNADYTWGASVTFAQVQVGDIIQFRNYQMSVTTVTRTTGTDGSVDQQTATASESRPHHTAIVESVGSDGELTVLEQNVGGVRRVLRNNLLFQSNSTTRTTTQGTSTTTVTRTVTVSGTLRYYHPQPR